MNAVEPTPTTGHGFRWGRWAILALVLVFGSMWAYVLWFAPRTGAYRVRDDAWRATAQQICADANVQRRALADTTEGYIAHPSHEQMLRHAELVDKATTILSTMLDDIEAVPLTDEKDQLRVDTFMKYYRVILADRARYTERLRRFELAPYQESLLPEGGPVTNIVTDFTSGNDIKACVPPGELGGS